MPKGPRFAGVGIIVMSDIQRSIRTLLRISSGEWTKKALAEAEQCHPDTIANIFAHLRRCGIKIECTGYPDYRFFTTRGGEWWVKSIPKNDALAIRRELRIEAISDETLEAREIRLSKDREYQRRYYPNLKKRKEVLRSEKKHAEEIDEVRAAALEKKLPSRKEKQKEYYRLRKASETPEARAERLKKSKEYYIKFLKKK